MNKKAILENIAELIPWIFLTVILLLGIYGLLSYFKLI